VTRTLSEIVAEVERQARSYHTVILPTDDAMRLLALAALLCAVTGWR
jgi:hypothetical protein